MSNDIANLIIQKLSCHHCEVLFQPPDYNCVECGHHFIACEDCTKPRNNRDPESKHPPSRCKSCKGMYYCKKCIRYNEKATPIIPVGWFCRKCWP